MPRASKSHIAFVRALLRLGSATTGPDGRAVAGKASLAEGEVRGLCAQGLLARSGDRYTALPGARTWLRRQLLEEEEEDRFAAQHRTKARRADGISVNLAESPLARLAVAASGETSAFLERHQVEAGERVRRLAERARLQPRVTMNYSAAHTAGGGPIDQAAQISDMAAEARRQLAEIPRVLPRDCAGVVLDVCGLLKGLQCVESERGWPRRSAKLVLRIGLEQLAQHYGYAASATGIATGRRRAWLGEGARPERFE